MQNSPQVIVFGMADEPIPPRKRMIAAIKKKIIPIVMRRLLWKMNALRSWFGRVQTGPHNRLPEYDCYLRASSGNRHQGVARQGALQAFGADSIPHLQPMDRNSGIDLEAESHGPTFDLEHRDLEQVFLPWHVPTTTVSWLFLDKINMIEPPFSRLNA